MSSTQVSAGLALELYNAAAKLDPPAFVPVLAHADIDVLKTPPPNPDHPIRSVRFLKQELVPHLKGTGELRIAPRQRTGPDGKPITGRREFLFTAVDPATLPTRPPPPPPKKQLYTEVGVGVDFSHLNKRRQRARVEKITRDVQRMKEHAAKTAQPTDA